ncbi:MAG TPA: HlyD family efflux transporter periplasmic adaptor subunit [Anaeromyxobacter sp.]|nr:HlyD family efflux transporter periplasmic adaptor subunit [Anaeromyxobacter sp.]
MDIPRPDVSARRLKRRLFALGGALVLAGAVVLAALRMGPSVPTIDRRSLQIDAVVQGELVRQVRGTGTLVSRIQQRVVALASGRVERDPEPLKPGNEVESSTVLFKLDNPDAREALAAGRADYRAAVADLASLRAKLEQELGEERARVAEARGAAELATLEHDVDRQLLEQGAGAGLEEARSRVAAEQRALRQRSEEERLGMLQESVAAQLRAQQARVDGFKKALERREEIVNDLEVRAGMLGIVQRINIEPGQSITAGTEVALVAKPKALRAEVRVPEIDAHDLGVGQPVLVDAHNWTVAGRVERVDPGVRDGTVEVDVELTGPLPEGARPDLGVEALIELDRLKNVKHVARPVNARADSTTTLFRVKNGVAERVQVKLGKASVDRVVVLSGLSAGDQVIASDMSDYAGRDRLEVK